MLVQWHEGLKVQINQSLVKPCKDKYNFRYRINKHIELVLLLHTHISLRVYMCVCARACVCLSPHTFIFVWWSAEWLFRVDDYCWPAFLWLSSIIQCVCSCFLFWFAITLCMCVYCVFMCVWHQRWSAFWLHGPYPVKEVFAVTGKTCRHLDSVAKEDLQCSERRSEGKITHQIWTWRWKEKDYPEWIIWGREKRSGRLREGAGVNGI